MVRMIRGGIGSDGGVRVGRAYSMPGKSKSNKKCLRQRRGVMSFTEGENSARNKDRSNSSEKLQIQRCQPSYRTPSEAHNQRPPENKERKKCLEWITILEAAGGFQPLARALGRVSTLGLLSRMRSSKWRSKQPVEQPHNDPPRATGIQSRLSVAPRAMRCAGTSGVCVSSDRLLAAQIPSGHYRR
jgi:hypothetical protein